VRRPIVVGEQYQAQVGDRVVGVEVQRLGEGTYRVRMDGHFLEIDLRHVEGGAYSVLCGTRAREVDVQPAGAEDVLRVGLDGHSFEISVVDERRRRVRLARGGAHGAGAGEVSAPMPGKVVKVLVQPGDAVRAGQGVAVVEAMKMENELRAPRDGVVREVRVAAGQTVELQETLVVIA
jgi:biotin carboxyl carrier protein